ncbi:MAG: hypothetical protein C0596_10395 [Marinilabiliales bacterium]|nr:MAG: hypothetical protein C0596_10395 [Marinilabiliales bacterium]
MGFWSCNNYGTKLTIDDMELYYTDEVSEDDAEAVGEYLQELELTEGGERTAQITKDGDTYQFRMVIKEGHEDDPEVELLANIIAMGLSEEVFDGDEVEVHLCDDQLETIEVIEMEDYDDEDYDFDDEYEMKVFDGTEIEYDYTITKSEVNDLGNFLIETGFTDGTTKSIVFVYDDDAYIFKMVVDEDTWDDPEFEEIAKTYAKQMSDEVFYGMDVEIHLCDPYFNTKTRVKM